MEIIRKIFCKSNTDFQKLVKGYYFLYLYGEGDILKRKHCMMLQGLRLIWWHFTNITTFAWKPPVHNNFFKMYSLLWWSKEQYIKP